MTLPSEIDQICCIEIRLFSITDSSAVKVRKWYGCLLELPFYSLFVFLRSFWLSFISFDMIIRRPAVSQIGRQHLKRQVTEQNKLFHVWTNNVNNDVLHCDMDMKRNRNVQCSEIWEKGTGILHHFLRCVELHYCLCGVCVSVCEYCGELVRSFLSCFICTIFHIIPYFFFRNSTSIKILNKTAETRLERNKK